MNGPPIAGGGVLVDGGRIVAVGDAAGLASRAERTHELEGVLLPGLVSGATEVELHDAGRVAVSQPHATWVRAVEDAVAGWSGEDWMRSARRGVVALLRAGVTTAFDAVLRGPGVPAAAQAGLGGDSLVTIRMVDADEQDAVLAALAHSLTRPAGERRVGVLAGGTWLLGSGVLANLGRLAAHHRVALHVRAAESEAEVAALQRGEGPLADHVRMHGMGFEWLDGGTGTRPVAYLDQLGVLRPGTVLVGGVWVDAAEARRLADVRVPVVLCPRTAEALGGGHLPLEHYADSGVALALGTGSPAASGDPDPLAEAALWVAAARDRGLSSWPSPRGPIGLEEQALRLLTSAGAQALGAAAGVLEAGRRADLVGLALDTTPADAYRDVVAHGAGRVVLTVLAGVARARRPDPAVRWTPQQQAAWADGDAAGPAADA